MRSLVEIGDGNVDGGERSSMTTAAAGVRRSNLDESGASGAQQVDVVVRVADHSAGGSQRGPGRIPGFAHEVLQEDRSGRAGRDDLDGWYGLGLAALRQWVWLWLLLTAATHGALPRHECELFHRGMGGWITRVWG